MATATSAAKVPWVAPALVRVTVVPGSSTGYWATPQPQMTAATPSAAITRVPLVRPAVSKARTASPQAPASTTSGSARPASRLKNAGSGFCSSNRAASDSAPATMAAA
jgi:hypothetical protein